MSTNAETTKVTDAPQGNATPKQINENRLPVPDSIAITVLIVLAAMVIAGWFDPMLPWVK